MKEKEDNLATIGWLYRVEKDPHQVITHFFAFAHVKSYRKMIKGVLLTAYRDKVYNKDEPGHIVVKFKAIESLIFSAHALEKEHKGNSAKVKGVDLLNKKVYCGQDGALTEWDYFPRSLSAKEFKNPYLVFSRFFKYQDLHKWRADLQEVLENALTKSPNDMEVQPLPVYIHLTKLIESAHLINLREIAHVSGRKKQPV